MLLLLAGNYAVFEKTAAERLRNLRSRIESQEAHRKHVQVRFWQLHLHATSVRIILLDERPCCNFETCGQNERALVQAFIDKFRFNAKRASMVQSRIKALNRLEDVG